MELSMSSTSDDESLASQDSENNTVSEDATILKTYRYSFNQELGEIYYVIRPEEAWVELKKYRSLIGEDYACPIES